MKPLPLLLTGCFVASSLFFSLTPSSFLAINKTKANHSRNRKAFFFTTITKMTDTAKTPVPAWKDEDPIFEKVEIEASIDPSVWTYYLLHRLQSFLDTTSENIPTGCYTVKVRFVVEIDGRISSAIALNNPGYGFCQGFGRGRP